MADAGSVQMTRQPGGLISALEKISADTEPLEAANKATAHLYIVNPFKKNISENKDGHGSKGWFSSLFNTHPPVKERIKILKEMA
jgi:heat shock protein HtpX